MSFQFHFSLVWVHLQNSVDSHCARFNPADHFCWRVHRGRGPALAHEALLLLWMWDHSGWPALHHEGWKTTLLQLLWVPLCRVLRRLWGTHRYNLFTAVLIAAEHSTCNIPLLFGNHITEPSKVTYCNWGRYHCYPWVPQLERGGVGAMRCGRLLLSLVPGTIKDCVRKDAPLFDPYEMPWKVFFILLAW